MDRILLHVDMDAFFAACEELRHPELAGKPIVVGADPRDGSGRGVVVACNYPARTFGIRSAMSIQEAWRRNPDAHFLPTDHPHYMETSRRIFGALREHHELQQASVDEAYIEATGSTTWHEARAFAEAVAGFVADATGGLGCSIGVAPNKLVAKIATEQQKPRGITVVRPGEVQGFLDPLAAKRIPGIGPKTTERLAALGLHTIRDLRLASRADLEDRFGAHGQFMRMAAQGQSDSAVHTERERNKSISEERTFHEDTRERHVLLRSLRRMVSDLEHDLARHQYWFRNVALKVRFSDFDTHTKQASLSRPSQDTTLARRVLPALLEEFLQDPRPVRLVGVRFGDLARPHGQRTLTQFPQADAAL